MLSRVAETIFWLGRYLERTENQARLISVNSHLLLDLPAGYSPGWTPLIHITGTREEYLKLYSDFSERNVRSYLIDDTKSHASLLNTIRYARENARTIRDVMPREVWEQINILYIYAKENAWKAHDNSHRFEYLKKIILQCQQLSGMFSGTMNHDITYAFLNIGKNLERVDMTSRIIDVRSTDLLEDENTSMKPFNTIQWMGVLKSLSAYQMYRLERQVEVTREEVLNFLFLSKVFPRSLYFCLDAIDKMCDTLPDINRDGIIALIKQTQSQLKMENIEDLRYSSLHEFIDELQLNFIEISNLLAGSYFLSTKSQSQKQEAS